MPLRGAIRRRPLAAFFGLAYGISWALWLSAAIFFPVADPMAAPGPGVVLLVLGTFGPFAAAVVVAWTMGTVDTLKRRLFRWRVAPRWYGIAVGLPVVVGGLTYGIYRGLGGSPLDGSQLLPLPAVVGMFVFTLLAGGGNEEPGWRGFALPRLQERYGPTVGTAILAVLWMGWHLPAFFTPASSQAALPPAAWAVGVAAIAVVLTWLYNVSDGSVPVAAIFHAMFNVVALWILSGLPADAIAQFYWIGVLLFAVCAGGLVIATGTDLGYAAFTDGRQDREDVDLGA